MNRNYKRSKVKEKLTMFTSLIFGRHTILKVSTFSSITIKINIIALCLTMFYDTGKSVIYIIVLNR